MKIINSNKNKEENKISYYNITSYEDNLVNCFEKVLIKNQDSPILIDFNYFEKEVEKIKHEISRFLYDLLIEKNDFLKYFYAVKDMFLTFKDEFFHNFILKIKDFIRLPFDKKIEDEINENYFLSSLKEVYKVDENKENYLIYRNFKIKLLSNGFNFLFDPTNLKALIDNKEIIYSGGLGFDNYTKKLRYLNTIYKDNPGSFWSLRTFELDEDFSMNISFILKNITQASKDETDKFKMSLLNTSFITNKKEEVVKRIVKKQIILNFSKTKHSIHITKDDLDIYFLIDFEFVYETRTVFPNKMEISLKFCNKNKTSKTSVNENLQKNEENESILKTESFISNLEFLSNEKQVNIFINYKNNFLEIFDTDKNFLFTFPFNLNYFLSKYKRLVNCGIFWSI
jgi:hypothetical protein